MCMLLSCVEWEWKTNYLLWLILALVVRISLTTSNTGFVWCTTRNFHDQWLHLSWAMHEPCVFSHMALQSVVRCICTCAVCADYIIMCGGWGGGVDSGRACWDIITNLIWQSHNVLLEERSREKTILLWALNVFAQNVEHVRCCFVASHWNS